MIDTLKSYFNSTYAFNLELAEHRLEGKRELLLFVNSRESFEICFDDLKWPPSIGSLDYEKSRPTHLPPQFSIVLRNVPLNIETEDLLNTIKEVHPNALTIHRILNKDKRPTSFVRVDLQSVKTIDEILKKRFIYANNIRLAVSEYLAPAKVLVCNRCFQIGHFRSTCRSDLERCRTCGIGVKHITLHKDTCDKKQCCVRCKGVHESNDSRCPVVLAFRAQLTRTLLNTRSGIKPNTATRTSHTFNDRGFPILSNQDNPNARAKDFNYIRPSACNHTKHMDELESKVKDLDQHMQRLIAMNSSFADQTAQTHQLIMKHEKEIQINRIDSTFQKEFISQFVSPICQVIVEIISSLVQQQTLKDKTLLSPSLTELCSKLTDDLTVWTNKFAQNEVMRTQISNVFNTMAQRTTETPNSEEACPPAMN